MVKSTLFTFLGVASSLTGFIGDEAGASGWGFFAADHAGYVLVALGAVTALVFERRPSVIALSAHVLAGLTALAFVIVALVKYYSDSAPFAGALTVAFNWSGEASLFATAALAFGLTLQRRNGIVAIGALAAAIAIAIGSGIYAITLERDFAALLWWLIAGIGAFLAAATAAGLERGGSLALRPPVPSGAGGDAGSDPGVE